MIEWSVDAILRVEIKEKKTKKPQTEDTLSIRFQEFFAKEKLWPLGGGGSGLGNYVGYFPIEYKEKLEEWFQANDPGPEIPMKPEKEYRDALLHILRTY